MSVGYGFICGAYMPMSNFPVGLQKALSFLPGSYGTSLMHNHWMRGAFDEMLASGLPQELIDGMRDGVDCNLYFGGTLVSEGAMYAIIIGSTLVIVAAYVLINIFCRPRYGDR